MRRSTRTASVILACTAAFAAVGGATTAAQASAAASPLCSTGSQTLQIANLAFQPPAIFPGQSSVLTGTIINCSNVSQTAGVEWLAHFVGFTTGQPAGCPVIDPLLESVTLAPGSVATGNVAYTVPGGCTAPELMATVEILQGGKIVAQRSAELAIEQPLPPGLLP